MRPGSRRVQRVACGFLVALWCTAAGGLRRWRPAGHRHAQAADVGRADRRGCRPLAAARPEHRSAPADAARLPGRQSVLRQTGMQQPTDDCGNAPIDLKPQGRQRDDRGRRLRVDGALWPEVQNAVRRLHPQNPTGGFGVHMFFGNFVETWTPWSRSPTCAARPRTRCSTWSSAPQTSWLPSSATHRPGRPASCPARRWSNRSTTT